MKKFPKNRNHSRILIRKLVKNGNQLIIKKKTQNNQIISKLLNKKLSKLLEIHSKQYLKSKVNNSLQQQQLNVNFFTNFNSINIIIQSDHNSNSIKK